MKKTACTLLCLALALWMGTASACTSIIVGREASADGSLLVGRNEDIYTAYNFYQNMSSDAIALVDKKYITELEKYKARADELVTEAVKNETEYEKQAEKATKTESTNTESNNEGGSETTA